MEYQIFNGRKICVKGIGVLFYEKGLPLTISISELNKKDIEVSMMHVVEEFWENGWSWKTIESKLKGEIGIDIEKNMNIDFKELKYFYDCLEQPKRKNGGYEESREMIFQFLFNCSTNDVRNGKDKKPLNYLRDYFNNN